MKIVTQVGIIFSICWISQIIEKLLPFSFPASVIGMILLSAGMTVWPFMNMPNRKSAIANGVPAILFTPDWKRLVV